MLEPGLGVVNAVSYEAPAPVVWLSQFLGSREERVGEKENNSDGVEKPDEDDPSPWS